MSNILIIGAGPTGLTAGVELSRLGHQVRIIDRRSDASGFSRAVGITQTSLDYLRPSGVADAIINEGVKIRSARFFEGSKHITDLELSNTLDAFLLALAQDRTEWHLSQAFRNFGGILDYGTALESLEQDDQTVLAHLSDGTTHQSKYLLGADGIKSTVRTELNIPYDGFDLPEDWSIADAYVEDWPHIEHFTVFWLDHSGGIAVAAPLEANRVRFIANKPDALAALPIPVTVTDLKRSGTFKISIKQVKHYSQARVFLAGDAAHCHSPAGGRGMNLGMEDAYEFAHMLHENRLEDYATKRHEEGAKIIARSEAARKAMTALYPQKYAVKLVLRMLGAWPSLSRKLAATNILR